MNISSVSVSDVGQLTSQPAPVAVSVPQPVAVSQPDQSSAANPSLDQVKNAVSQINNVVQNIDKSLEFNVDQSSGKVVIKVMDTENNKVLMQFPSQDALAISQALGKLQGLLVRQKA